MTSPVINRIFFRLLLVIVSMMPCYVPIQAQTQRFKQIDYQYDLISGKVNEVHYQASQPDAFYHRYEYDADNRITKVYTSKDSINWDQDASYTYYSHGPLARVELGDNNVQGMDYVYTLQGWIKGVNSNLLKAENDIGNDGLSGTVHSSVAKDAFGYTLNYHANDYQTIDAANWSNTALRFEALTPNSDLMAARFDLYNGNISSMVTTIVKPKVYTGAANEVPNILPQGTAYQYDQLNRLLEMKAFQNLDVAANTWKQGSTYSGLYHNVFEYDANGNILYQERAGQNGLAFDKLTYQYKTGTDGRRVQNRLYHVNDGNTNTTLAPDDVEDQENFILSPPFPLTINDVNNYQYDELGNLKYDSLEGIAKIEWTVYGKIKRITRLSNNLRSDLEFQYDASGNRVAKIEKPRDANGLKPPSEWIATYYTRDAQGNVMGIYKHQPLTVGPSFKVIERNVYGSSRLGSDYSEVELINTVPVAGPFVRVLGNKHFEGSNHLGNVLAVVSDRKIPRDDDGDGVVEYFQGEVLSASDYSPFGVVLDGRDFGMKGRYGFNGKENDDEVKGGNSLDFGARVYDSRLCRFLSSDFKKSEYAFQSSYLFSSNNPIKFVDYNGDFTIDPAFKIKYPKVSLILENAGKLYNNQDLPSDVKEALKDVDIQKIFNENFRPALEELSTLNYTQIQEVIAPNSGPVVQSKSLTRLARPGEQNVAIDGTKEVNGRNEVVIDDNGNPTNKNITEQGVITLDKNMVAKLEQQLGGEANYNGVGGTGTSVKGKNAALLGVISTLFHEVVHFGRNKTGVGNKGADKGSEWEKKVYKKNIDPPASKELEQNE